MPLNRVWLLSILPFGAWAQVTSSQTFSVNPSAIAGVSVSGRGMGQYPPNVDIVLGSARNEATNFWLPFGIIVSNNTSQPIVGFAARWTATDSSGQESVTIMTRSLFQSPELQIAPGQSVVLLPFWLLANQHRGIRGSLDLGYQPSDLRAFQNARSIRVTLDGVVFGSGQFVGPNEANEYGQLQADGIAGYNLASAVLAKWDARDSVSSIVAWLQQTAASRPTDSVWSRDWTAAITARTAGIYLRAYNSGGGSRLYGVAQQQVQSPHITIYR